MEIKYSRKQYIITKECDHRTYWSQFVTDGVKELVLRHIPKEKLMASEDPHFNDIPLQRWDRLHALVPQYVKNAICDSNASMYPPGTEGGYSMSDMTCLLKEAARQIVEREREAEGHLPPTET